MTKKANEIINNATEIAIPNTAFHSAMVKLGIGTALTINNNVTLHSKNEDGALSIQIDNAEVALVASSIQSIAAAGSKLSAGMSVALAMIERDASFKTMKFKNATDCGVALTGLDRATIQAYLNVGKTFFDKDGLPLKPFVTRVSNAHLNQLQGKLRKKLVVYGNDFDLNFIENIFDTVPNMTVGNLRELLAFIDDGTIPEKFVSYSEDGKTAYLSGPNEIILKGYEKPQPIDTTNAPVKPSNSPKEPTDAGKATNSTTDGNGIVEKLDNTFESNLVSLTTAIDSMVKYISQFDTNADNALSTAFKAKVNDFLVIVSDFESATHDESKRAEILKK